MPPIKLRIALLRSGRRQYEIADALGITETRMSRIACGRLRPTASEARRLAELLGIELDDIIAGGDAHDGPENATAPTKESAK